MVEKGQWPPFKPESDGWFKFIEEQKEIFNKGFEVGGDRITGPHYWKLNFCHIGIANERGAKVPTLPYFSDAQKEFYDTVEDIYKTGENLLGLKTRDKGWTYDVADYALFCMMNVDFSEVLAIFPGGTSLAKANFRKAYEMAENNLDFDFKHPRLKSTEGKYIEEISYGVEIAEVDPHTGAASKIKKVIGPQTKLVNIIATNPSVVRSGRCQLIIIEEFGEIVQGKDIIGVAQANLREGARKLGPIIAGGTSNQFGPGFADFKDVWLNPGQYNFRKLWIPSNKSYWGFTNKITGESDLDGAKEHLLKIRESLKGKDLLINKQEYALTEDEALFEGSNSVYDVEKCNRQISLILSDNKIKNAIQRGNFYPKKVGGGKIEPVFEIERNGRFEVFKHPDKSLKYAIVGGLDSYRMGGKPTDSPSKGAIEFYVPFQGMSVPGDYPAAVYWDRPEDKDVFFMDSMLATMYYDTQILVELTDEDIIAFYKAHNALKLLKERPNIIKSQYSKAENKYGVVPTAHNKAMALEYSIKIFNANYDQIVFVELLREMIKFAPDVNTDRVDAHNWAVLHAMDNMKVLEEYRRPQKERRFSPFTACGPNGDLIVVRTIEEALKLGLSNEPMPKSPKEIAYEQSSYKNTRRTS